MVSPGFDPDGVGGKGSTSCADDADANASPIVRADKRPTLSWFILSLDPKSPRATYFNSIVTLFIFPVNSNGALYSWLIAVPMLRPITRP